MAFERPTLEELVQRITTDLETRLGIVGARLRNSFTTLFGKVIAGAAHLLHGHLDYISKQIFPQSADSENLARIASIWDITKEAATFAEGQVTFTGIDGTVIDEETELTSADGIIFKTTEEATIDGGEAVVAVRSTAAGLIGNSESGTVLTVVSPVTGLNGEATVTSALSGGEDEESDESLLARLLDRIQTPPMGGAKTDYEKWAKEVPGVTRAWAYPLYLGEGTVATFFVKDEEDPIIPTTADVDEVSAYIEERRPVTAHQYVFAPTADEIDFDISVFPEDDADVQANVYQELLDLFSREAEPGGTIPISHVNEAISLALGEVDHVLNSPTGDIEASDGYIPVVGDITWS